MEDCLSKYLKDYTFLFSISGLVIFFDQWTKNLVRDNLYIGEMWVPWEWMAPYARIIHWQNTGAAFGLGQNLSWVFTVLAFVVVGAIIYYFPQVDRSSWLIRIALSMQMGGALGNLIDRLTQDIGVWLEGRNVDLATEVEVSTSETEQSLNIEEIQGE